MLQVRFLCRRLRCRLKAVQGAVFAFGSALLLAFIVLSPLLAEAADFLDPAQAFQFSAHLADPSHVEVHYKIAKGYYLYKERFRFATDSDLVKLGTPEFPPAELKFDETFNKNVEHYRDEVTVRIPILTGGVFTLQSTAQGCADAGLCYPPQLSTIQLDTKTATSAAAPPPSAASPGQGAAGQQVGSVLAALQSGNLPWIAVFFVGLGLLLSFTPCVWPMFPILSSIIAGDAGSGGGLLTRTRGLLLAVAYSLGIAVIYTALGIGAGLAGEGLAQALQRPAVLLGFAAALAALSMSMFGFYQLQVPGAWQTRLNAITHRAEGGRFIGVFFMGAISALVVGPCVAAPLAGTLLYISQTRDVWIGGVALFSLAMGMCAPLLVLGAWEGAWLPRAGAWMESVKQVFGVLLLAVAIWMVTPVFPAAVIMVLWATLLIVSSVYMRAFDALASGASGWARLWKGVGLLLFIAGVAQVVGVSTGGTDPLRPLGALAQRTSGEARRTPALAFETIHSSAELDRYLGQGGKPMLVDFTADWCVACREMEQQTYVDQRVASRMAHFKLIKADVTQNSADERQLLKRFSLYGPPGILFFSADGRPLPQDSVIGYQDADTFLASLAQVLS